jgi:hypothetical protein
MSTTLGTCATPSSSCSTDVDMTNPPPVTTNVATINVNKPDLYYRERAKLDDWLMQWDLFFMF